MNITCPQCGFTRQVNQNRIPAGSLIAKCPKCECRFRFSEKEGVGAILPPKHWQDAETPSEEEIRETARQAYEAEARRFESESGSQNENYRSAPSSIANPWQQAPGKDGWLAALWQTILLVMLKPGFFFRTIHIGQEWQRPLVFFIIICLCQTLIERMWGQIIYSYLSTTAATDPKLASLLFLLAPETNMFMLLALRVLSLLGQLFLFSLLLYLGYRLIAKNRVTYRLVLEILCYSCAPWLLCIIPGIGSIAGTIWGICCLAIGYKTSIGLKWGETIAGFLPLFILFIPLMPQMFSLLGQ